MLKAWCYRLAPLLFGGNHILVIFAPNTCIRNFLRAPNAKISLPWEGGQTLRSLADYFRRHGNIGHFQRHSLIIKMNVSETARSKLDVIVLPLGIWRKSYSSNLCPKYASESFSGSKCKIFPALGGGTLPPRPSPCSVAPFPCSSPRRSAHSDFRTPPQKTF